MTTATDIFSAANGGLSAIFADTVVAVVISGTSITGRRSGQAADASLTQNGEEGLNLGLVRCKTIDIPTSIALGQTINIGGADVFVTGINPDPSGVTTAISYSATKPITFDGGL